MIILIVTITVNNAITKCMNRNALPPPPSPQVVMVVILLKTTQGCEGWDGGNALIPVWNILACSLQGHDDPLEGGEEEKDSRSTRDLPPPSPQADHHLPACLGSG